MLGLLKWVIGLTVILSALIVLARVVAPPDVYAFPLNSINLTADCQLPCWHGITPGVTTRAEALAIFDADPAYLLIETDNISGLDVRYLDPSSNSDAYLYFDENGITIHIELHGSDTMYHVVAKLGKPTRILVGNMCNQPWLGIFQGALVSGWLPQNENTFGELEPNKLSDPLIIAAKSAKTIEFFNLYKAGIWHGFRSQFASRDHAANCG